MQDGSSKYLHIPAEVIDKLNWEAGDIIKLTSDGVSLHVMRVATKEEKDTLNNLEMSFDRNSGIGSYLDSGL
ncbi:MAG: AbrB/MazE/SpoVT family DNA-binding domain-containing protein [Spirochaetales bacterium]|nr:AbrB/MazE/SpoVT family DNA-binding domain-containing protein [Spirochaetales bacterium]